MKAMKLRAWMPLALMTTLILALGAYATVRQDAFLTKYNLGNLLLTAMPLALVALGQTTALLGGGFHLEERVLVPLPLERAVQPHRALCPGRSTLLPQSAGSTGAACAACARRAW